MTNPVSVSLAGKALEFIRPMLVEAGRMALALRNDLGEVQIKTDETPVTRLDRDIEAMLVGRIRHEYPHHRILAEEGSIGGSDPEFTWVIDPLDGTRAYASGLPLWGISVGLLHNEEPLAGAFHLPAVNELYWGDRRSAFLNGQPLLPPVAALDSPLVFLAVPSNSHLLYDISFGRLRSFGSTAAHLIYVARGAAIGALTRQVKIWDLAGVLPILSNTGIALHYLSGRTFNPEELLDGRPAPEPLVAAPFNVIDQVCSFIRFKDG